MSHSPAGPVAIAGAGIGGLTAALALARRGFEVTVFERADVLEAAGAGIQLTPNALNVLFGLGLGPALEAPMVSVDSIFVRRGSNGRLVARLPLEAFAHRWGTPYGVIHRADLQAALLGAVEAEAGITLHYGDAIDAAEQDGSGVGLRFASGRRERMTALIGADGLWSSVRRSLGRIEPPRFAGRRAWRTVIAMTDAPPLLQGRATGLWLGAHAHLVHYPVRGGSQLNLVAVTQDGDSAPGWSTPQDTRRLRPHFAGWDPRIRALLAACPDWRTWPLFDRAADAAMAEGRIALLGDAAHPMLPFAAQGGAAAIEDAAVLALALAAPGEDDIPARLALYSARRLPRVTRLQAEARSNGERYHWSWPFSAARDLGLAAMGGRKLVERYDWIYGWTPTAGERIAQGA
ncbi:FAD-dependent monooxygenase [Labrys monachus]|uniref:Salicylate hydroxylase n=1 Tax=Labrys monachus TaxID=217067 RepID=A0ABU0FIJ9_9HYPH|nr:FAD-dependent monooxygenase [Labrys monachus]MDQ0393933.1 salicylate hydroxylase [Labrys monachus]